MKILIRHEHNASHYIYTGILRAFNAEGHECYFWNSETTPAFDMFNVVEPDMFIGQGYNLDRATIKCIKLRPDMKVLLKVGCWGPVCQDVDTEKYPILLKTDEETKNVEKIANAVKNTFGDNIPKISSTKSLSGHPLGAASVHEAIYCLIMMKNNFITGSANITEMDDEAKKFPIITKTEKGVTLNSVMSNSFGFGGTNAALIFEKV